MREIDTHKCSDLNEAITITVLDGPGPGGANHSYEIFTLGDAAVSSSRGRRCKIMFQKGAVKDVGLNGISDEALLAVVADRLDGFQSGEFACKDNITAANHVKMAMRSLRHRTFDRKRRGVEGHAKK